MFLITSEENFYGGTNKKFEDGKVFKAQLKRGKWIEIFLSVTYIHSMISKQGSILFMVLKKMMAGKNSNFLKKIINAIT